MGHEQLDPAPREPPAQPTRGVRNQRRGENDRYYASPNVKQPGIGSVMPGGVLAVVLWIVVSVAFAFYVANFGSYDKTYGALGGVIVFLVWLWLTNLAILLGAQFNAERARGRHIAAGHAPDQEPYLPPRSHPR